MRATTPVAALTARERFVDGIDVQAQMRRNAVENTDQCGAVRLAGRQVTKHAMRPFGAGSGRYFTAARRPGAHA